MKEFFADSCQKATTHFVFLTPNYALASCSVTTRLLYTVSGAFGTDYVLLLLCFRSVGRP